MTPSLFFYREAFMYNTSIFLIEKDGGGKIGIGH